MKKEVGAEQDEQEEEAMEEAEAEAAGGKSAVEMELSRAEETAQEGQLAEAPPNGDLTPEMILSMMDR